jgi:hypothetical protein
MLEGTLKKKDSDAVVQESELNAALDPRGMTQPEKIATPAFRPTGMSGT